MLHRIPLFAPTIHAHGLVALAMLELILDVPSCVPHRLPEAIRVVMWKVSQPCTLKKSQ